MLSVFLTAIAVLIVGGAVYLIWNNRPSKLATWLGGGTAEPAKDDQQAEVRGYKYKYRMPCSRCIEALENAGQVLNEMRLLDADSLPPETDWQGIAEQLIRLAGKLRISAHRNDLLESTE
jgi:hypothetical protein